MGNDIPERGTLRLAKAKQATDPQGVANMFIKIPGEPMAQSPRMIFGGRGWFEGFHADDWCEVYTVDVDSIIPVEMRPPSWPIVGSYTETSLGDSNKGWFIPAHEKCLSLNASGGVGRPYGGLYINIIAHTGDARQDVFRANLDMIDPTDV